MASCTSTTRTTRCCSCSASPSEDPLPRGEAAAAGVRQSLRAPLLQPAARAPAVELLAELFSYLRVLHAEAEELATLAAAPDALTRARTPLSEHNKAKLRPALVAACEARLARYPTSLEEDERMLREELLTLNARNCILLRRGEKRLLQSYVEW